MANFYIQIFSNYKAVHTKFTEPVSKHFPWLMLTSLGRLVPYIRGNSNFLIQGPLVIRHVFLTLFQAFIFVPLFVQKHIKI
jgi:hypothetical protein